MNKKNSTDITPPEWLPEESVKIWERLMPQVLDSGVFTDADYDPFLQLVIETSKYYQLERDIMQEGMVSYHTNKAGETNMVPNPKTRIQKACFENMHRLQKQFGLGAGSRKQVPHKKTTGNEFDSF